MNREFGYSWQRPKMIIFVIPILIGYIIWRYERFNVQDAIILAIAIAWPLWNPWY
jgi:hypothetical protein